MHAAVTDHVVRAAVVAHDAVEHRRMFIGIELVKQFFHCDVSEV